MKKLIKNGIMALLGISFFIFWFYLAFNMDSIKDYSVLVYLFVLWIPAMMCVLVGLDNVFDELERIFNIKI